MPITIPSSPSGYTLSANNTIASVGSTVTVGGVTSDVGIYLYGNNDTVINAGTLMGDNGVLVGNSPGHGTGDVFVNLASGYVGASMTNPETSVLFTQASGTVINSGQIGKYGAGNRAIGLQFGGSITNTSSGTIEGGGVSIANAPGIIVNDGLIKGKAGNGYGNIYMGDGGTVTNLADGSILNSGFKYGIDIAGGPATVDNAGYIGGLIPTAVTFAASTYADLVIDHPGAHFGGSVIGGGANSTFELAAGSGTVDQFESEITNFGTLLFAPNADWTVNTNVDIAATTIVGFTSNDVLGIYGVGSTPSAPPTVTQSYSNGITDVTITGDLTLAFAGTFGAFQATPIDGDTAVDLTVTLCFGPGTMIGTSNGEKRVEDLAVGDTVRTLGNNGTRTITWIGVGKVLATRGHRSAATPVIVRKNALGPNMPHEDLRITKAHGLYFDDVLIPVEFLVNHKTILWDDHATEVQLYHIELDAHDVVFANGALAESYRDDGNRWLFQNANTGWGLAPQEPCAPVLTGGPVVDAVWRCLLDRAGPRALPPLTNDPDLHLIVDGKRIDAAETHGQTAVFRLDTCPTSVHIASRDGVPTELGLSRDPRRLGVALTRVTLRRGTRFVTIDAADERLTDGFHGYEAADGLRWTNGFAALPADLFDGFGNGGVEIVLTLEGETRYPDFGERVAA